MVRGRFLLCSLAVAWLACPATASDLPAPEESKARKLYRTKCARCHKFYSPADYSPTDWASWMQRMARKAKLKSEQDRLIRQYLDAWRRDPQKPPP